DPSPGGRLPASCLRPQPKRKDHPPIPDPNRYLCLTFYPWETRHPVGSVSIGFPPFYLNCSWADPLPPLLDYNLLQRLFLCSRYWTTSVLAPPCCPLLARSPSLQSPH
ncbi:unnamed protein product, partial [Staurois parvus]